MFVTQANDEEQNEEEERFVNYLIPSNLTSVHILIYKSGYSSSLRAVKLSIISSKKLLAKTASHGTKKLRSDSPGLVDFVVGIVEFILHLPHGQVKVLGKFFFEIN